MLQDEILPVSVMASVFGADITDSIRLAVFGYSTKRSMFEPENVSPVGSSISESPTTLPATDYFFDKSIPLCLTSEWRAEFHCD